MFVLDFSINILSVSTICLLRFEPSDSDERLERPTMCTVVRYWFLRMLLITVIFSVLFGLLVQIWMYYQSLSDDLDLDKVNIVGYALFCNHSFVKGWNVRQCRIQPGLIECNVQNTEPLDILVQPPINLQYRFENNTLTVNQTLTNTCIQWMLYSFPF